MNDGIGLAGAYGGKYSTKDILLMYKGLLGVQQDQAESGLDEAAGITLYICEEHIATQPVSQSGKLRGEMPSLCAP